ncbi:MAG: hypothetical protein AAF797_12310 [Planctomycetota bacterium]
MGNQQLSLCTLARTMRGLIFVLFIASSFGCTGTRLSKANEMMHRANIPVYDHDLAARAIAAGASLDDHPTYGSWVTFAAEKGNNDLLELALRSGGNPNPSTDGELVPRTPLGWAVWSNNPLAVNLLIQFGASTDTLDGEGRIPSDYITRLTDPVIHDLVSSR